MSPDEFVPLKLAFEVGGEPRTFEVSSGHHVLGRVPDCGIIVNDPSVSRHHAMLTLEAKKWVLRDKKATNGTFVNGVAVSEQAIQDGDVITLGSVDIACEIGISNTVQTSELLVEEDEFDSSLLTQSIRVDDFKGVIESMDPVQNAAWVVTILHDAAKALLSHNDLRSTLDNVMDLVFEHLPAHRGFIMVYQGDELVPMVERAREGLSTAGMRISRRIADMAVESMEAVLVTPGEEFDPSASMVMMQVHSALCAPLYHEGRVSGLIYVDRTTQEETFAETHRGVLSVLATLSAAAVERALMRESIERERELRDRLSSYLAPGVVEYLLKKRAAHPGEMVSEEREVSVLFADIVGFTTLSEALPASEVTALLNHLFERLTETVFAEEGTLDKFIGDNMMVFFGAPLAQPDHALRAVRTGMAMQRELQAFNAERPGSPSVAMRIGINTGKAIVGDVGGPRRKDYTVIGDTVNIASRLESSVAKAGEVVIGPLTYEQVSSAFSCDCLEVVKLKGKQIQVQPYRVNCE